MITLLILSGIWAPALVMILAVYFLFNLDEFLLLHPWLSYSYLLAAGLFFICIPEQLWVRFFGVFFVICGIVLLTIAQVKKADWAKLNSTEV